MQILLNEMKLEDIEQVSQVEAINFSRPWKKKDFEKAYYDINAIYYTAKLNGKVIGVCGLYHLFGEGEIMNVSVVVEYRGNNISELMLKNLMEIAKEKQVESFTLEVRKSNASAIAVYQKLGFQIEGERKNCYDYPTENALIMWKR